MTSTTSTAPCSTTSWVSSSCGTRTSRNPFQLGTLTTTDDVAAEVRAVVDEQVNPALAAHGGFVTFMGHDGEGKVYLTMGGGCHGCSMSRMTMLQGVQTMIMEAVPAIAKVIDATDHTTGENPYFS